MATLNHAITGSSAAQVADAFGEFAEAAGGLADAVAAEDAAAGHRARGRTRRLTRPTRADAVDIALTTRLRRDHVAHVRRVNAPLIRKQNGDVATGCLLCLNLSVPLLGWNRCRRRE